MASEIWNLSITNKGWDKPLSTIESTNATRFHTLLCKTMISSFHEIEDDHNQYEIDVENLENEYEMIKGDANNKISKLLAEIKTLEAKEQNGTITEDEQKSLDSKKVELDSLFKTSDEQCANKKSEMNTKKEELANKYSQKEKTALDFGQKAIELGTPLSKIDVEVTDEEKEQYKKHGFIQGFIGSGAPIKTIKLAGIDAIETGTELIDKVNDSRRISKKLS